MRGWRTATSSEHPPTHVLQTGTFVQRQMPRAVPWWSRFDRWTLDETDNVTTAGQLFRNKRWARAANIPHAPVVISLEARLEDCLLAAIRKLVALPAGNWRLDIALDPNDAGAATGADPPCDLPSYAQKLGLRETTGTHLEIIMNRKGDSISRERDLHS